MKHIYKLFILVLFFFLTSCNINMGSSTPSMSVEQKNIELELNNTYNLVINFTINSFVKQYSNCSKLSI